MLDERPKLSKKEIKKKKKIRNSEITFRELEKWRAIRASVGGVLAWMTC